MKNSPETVLAAIDEFGSTKDFLMNVGREKGAVVTDIIAKEKPKTLLEIGCYVGFSAILFGNEFRKAGGQKYLSLELNPTFAAVARELIALAGLDQTVEIIEGPCRESLRKLQQQGAGAFEMVFIDHAKVLYLNELKLCEELGFVKPGTTVIADDMIRPGNAAYSAYVRDSPELKKQQFEKAKASTSEGDVSLGNPALIYETSLIDGREPSGNDVSVRTIILELQLLTLRTKGRCRDFVV
jgi:catechol O-methyltransferase